MKRIGVLVFTLVLCGAAALAMAAGDAAKGAEVAKGCACHKSKADLNGRDAQELRTKMLEFQAGTGENKAMISIMKKQSAENIDDLAAYYASLPKN
mgnify:CR=1 FL=1